MIETLLDISRATWEVAAAMAPYLLLGFGVAGLLSVYVSPAWLERHLGGRGAGPVFRASLFGVPLPLCSCGVIPVAASLRSRGAGPAATTAFLLSTPQTGVDSILVTWTMLGPVFAVFRPVAALVTGVIGGLAVQAVVPPAAAGSGAPAQAAAPGEASGNRLRAALEYGLFTLPGDIGRALLIGILIAGLVGALMPEDLFARYLGPGPLSILAMMVVGIPIYVCATASVPLAASFIFLGVSPGAALAFLIAGPATNAATLTTVARVLGRRTLVAFLATIAVSAFVAGLGLDWLMPRLVDSLPALAGAVGGHEHVGWFEHLCGGLLVVVMTWSWWRMRRSGGCCDGACEAQPGETESAFDVRGMNCSHCTASVQRAVTALPGVTDCRVELEPGRAVVMGESVDADAVVEAIGGLGFEAERAGD